MTFEYIALGCASEMAFWLRLLNFELATLERASLERVSLERVSLERVSYQCKFLRFYVGDSQRPLGHRVASYSKSQVARKDADRFVRTDRVRADRAQGVGGRSIAAPTDRSHD